MSREVVVRMTIMSEHDVTAELSCGHVHRMTRADAEERIEDKRMECSECAKPDEIVVRPSRNWPGRWDVVRVRALTPELRRDCAYCGCGGPGTHVCGVCRAHGIDGMPLEEEVEIDGLDEADAELEGIGLADDEGIKVRIEKGEAT